MPAEVEGTWLQGKASILQSAEHDCGSGKASTGS